MSTGVLLTVMAGGIIFVVALVSTIYAIATNAGDEGFMERDGNVLCWKKSDLPITVWLACDGDWVTLFRKCRETICTRAGVELFDLGTSAGGLFEEAPRGTLMIRSRRNYNEAPATDFEYLSDGSMLRAQVELPLCQSVPDRAREFVMMHELCHVLGLDHDRVSNSVMLDKYLPGARPELTERDAERLRAMYS